MFNESIISVCVKMFVWNDIIGLDLYLKWLIVFFKGSFVTY